MERPLKHAINKGGECNLIIVSAPVSALAYTQSESDFSLHPGTSAVFTLGMRLGAATALRMVGVVALLLGVVPSAVLATRLGRRQTVALRLLLVMLTYGATAVWVATPCAYALVLGVAGIGGAEAGRTAYRLMTRTCACEHAPSSEASCLLGLSPQPQRKGALQGLFVKKVLKNKLCASTVRGV